MGDKVWRFENIFFFALPVMSTEKGDKIDTMPLFKNSSSGFYPRLIRF